MASLLERLQKVGNKEVVKMSSAFDDSWLLNKVPEYPTSIIALNVALGGKIDAGVIPGLHVIAGPSKHFKTLYGLILAKTWMDANPTGVLILYDSEFGASKTYFEAVGIDTSRVLHVPISDVEMLRSDIAQKLSPREEGAVKRGEKVFILVDSIGNLASAKEVLDAENEKSVADMTRAKAIKSLYRIITPRLRMLEIPMVAINHTYQTMEMYSKAVVSGGTGQIYSANDIWIVGKSQLKDEEGLAGFCFTINIEKSRRVKEKKKIPVIVRFDGGMTRYSGLLQLCLELGVVTKPKVGWLSRELCDPKTGEVIPDRLWRLKEIEENEAAFFDDILTRSRFPEIVKDTFQVASGKLITGDETVEEETISSTEESANLMAQMAYNPETDFDKKAVAPGFAADLEGEKKAWAPFNDRG